MSPVIRIVCSMVRRRVRIEALRLGMRVDRLLEQPAVAARVDESGEELRIVAVLRRLLEQADQGVRRLAHVGFELRIVLVRHRQARAERERAIERGFARAPRQTSRR